MGTLMDCIAGIPFRSKQLINNKEVVNDQIVNTFDKTFKKLVVIGSGSSYNAGLFAKSLSEKELGISVELYYPNDFMYNTNFEMLNDEALYVFISQSGMTKLLIDSLKIVQEKGFSTVGITEDSTSLLANMCDLAMITLEEKEAYRFRTIGFTTTVILLYQLVLSLSLKQNHIDEARYQALSYDLNKVVDSMEPIRNESMVWFENHRNDFDLNASFIFTGAQQYWPVMKEADIKFMEMIPVLSNSFELEEIIHGPQNMFAKDQVFFILSDKGVDLEKAKQIKLFIEEEVKAKVFLISKDTFNEHIDSNEFNVLLYLMFFQVVGFSIAHALGKDLKLGTYPKVSEYVSKVVE